VIQSIPAGLTRVAIAGALGAVVLTGCGRGKQESGGGGFSMPPMPVQVAEVTAGTVENRYSVVGTLEAVEAVTVVAEINSRVVALPFREGQPIARGALIAQLDDTELAAEVARAEAQVAQRRSSYDRIRTVADQGAGTPQDLDDADAVLKIATADLAMARARLAKTRITAPFAGTTGARKVSVGAYVNGGVAITDLARIDELRVAFTAPERMLGRLKQGSPVTVTTTAYPDHVVQGTIDVIDPSLDAGTRAAHIVARVTNPNGLLRPGMSADVSVVLESREQAMSVPSEAVFVQAGQPLVYVVQADSTVAPRPVRLGLRETDTVEILEGLAPGDRVVRAGHQKLFPGAKVLPLPVGGGA
jgi:membrane fusion protein, multidrug efflux system